MSILLPCEGVCMTVLCITIIVCPVTTLLLTLLHSFHVTVNSLVNVITLTENFILALTGFYANIKHNQGPVLVS